MQGRGEDHRPFMMTGSLTHQRAPYVITRDHWGSYDDAGIDRARVLHIPVEARDAPTCRSAFATVESNAHSASGTTATRAVATMA